MDFFQTLILAAVQTITEFLSISSSAQPIPVPAPTGWEDQGLAFDAAVHGGTLLLILVWAPSLARVAPERPFAHCSREVLLKNPRTRNEKPHT